MNKIKYIKTEAKLKTLADKFTEQLRTDLKDKGHSKTGKLIKSIDITYTEKSGDFELEINALEYILFLEDGNFFHKFKEKITKELTEEIKDTISQDLQEHFLKLIK